MPSVIGLIVCVKPVSAKGREPLEMKKSPFLIKSIFDRFNRQCYEYLNFRIHLVKLLET